MNKLLTIAILTLLWACSKKEDGHKANPAPANPTPVNTFVEDDRLMGGWLLDSIALNDTIFVPMQRIHMNPHIEPPSDSIAFTKDHYKGYAFTMSGYYDADNIFDEWSTPYADSLFIHTYTSTSIYLNFGYRINGNTLIIYIASSSGGKYSYYYHRAGSNPAHTQDRRLIGMWVLDSIRDTGDPIAELCDSMLLSADKLIPYEWTGMTASLYGTWDTYNNSLYVYYYNAPVLNIFGYSISGNSMVIHCPAMDAIAKETMYYHKK